jgi:hypothetical protein
MAKSRIYLLDSNVLIEAHKRYYGFDICPGFWDAITRQHRKNRVFSLDRVQKEIDGNKDRLAEWSKSTAPETLFKPSDTPKIVRQFGELVTWVQAEPQYKPEAKAQFAAVADGWLIACAKAEGLILVTDEVYNRDIKKKVPIPNVCRHVDVEYINTFQMMRELGVCLIEQRAKISKPLFQL